MTDTILVTSRVESITSKTKWNETYEVPVGIDPEKYCKAIIIDWNEEEVKRGKDHPTTYFPDIRKFIKIVKVSNKIIKYCHMVKKNIHSKLTTYNRIFDVMICTKCGYKKRRYGLSESGLHKECHPEKTCKECGIEFKTVERFLSHIQRIHNEKQSIGIDKHE